MARCIFCGKRPLTKEHIFPKWLAPYIPKTMENYQNVKTIFHKDRADTAAKKRAGNPHSWSVKCVCKKCNNEWMGTLQERVKPILLPMIKGEKVKIEKADQHVMASWVAMATMCAEFRARTGSNTAPCRYGRMAVDRSLSSESALICEHWRGLSRARSGGKVPSPLSSRHTETNGRLLTLPNMEGPLDHRALRRTACLKINTRLHAAYDAALHEQVPERFVNLITRETLPDTPACHNCGLTMKLVIYIQPFGGRPGLFAYECPRCHGVESTLEELNRSEQPSSRM